jgi:PAS domain S-box-containing protein
MKKDQKAKGKLGSTDISSDTAPHHSPSKLNTKHQQIINQHVPIGIMECSREGKYIDVNEEFCQMLGYERDELLKIGIKDATHEDDFHVDMKLHRQLVAGEIPYYRLEMRYVRKDGQVIWVELARSAVRNTAGESLYTVGTVLDITERYFAEEALLHARTKAERTAQRITRLQQITAALTGMATTRELAGMILEQGAQATGAAAGILMELMDNGQQIRTVAALGYPSAAIRTEPMPLSTSSPISDSILTKQAIWIGSHEEFTLQFPELADLRASFGNEATTALPLIVGDRVLGGLAFSFVEVRRFDKEEREFFLAVAQQCAQALERARAEEALRESEQRLRAILSQATAGIVRKDVDGTFLFVNEAFCNMLGYTSEELVGRTCWDVTHQEDVEENQRLFERLMQYGIPFQLERRLLRRDGSILWSNVSVSPILDSAGKPSSGVGVEVDVTARKRAEDALYRLNLELEYRVDERTEELQEANQALQESRRRLQELSKRLVEVQEEERRALARELHDRVGQSLAALNLNLTIVRGQLAGQATEQVGMRLADSMQLVTEVIALVRDVMSDLRPSILDDYGLEAALQTHLNEFRARYGIQARFEKPRSPIRRLEASIEMTLLRIAQEALTNIARHAQADLAVLSLQLDDNQVCLQIEDNGDGIRSRQEASRPNSHGLKIMRERAEALGGSLSVVSAPGKGTRIEAVIPLPPAGQPGSSREK